MCRVTSLTSLITCVTDFIALLIPLGVAAALLVFIWGIAGMVLASGDAKAASDGRAKMLWGILALFVILSLSGIIQLVRSTFL